MDETIRELMVGDAVAAAPGTADAKSQQPKAIRQVLYYLGLAMVVGGCAMLGYTALFMLKLIHEPRDLELAGFVLNHIREGAQVVSGTIDGRSFYLRFDPSLLTGVYCILSLAMITTCAAVIRGLTLIGLRLMRLERTAAEAKTLTAN